ncbi:MAG: DUF4365 domain-containing protein [Deltaproteobacteria bacterium]
MITRQHQQEQLSRAYFNAVTAQAGHIFESTSIDYGVDGSLKHVKNQNGRRFPSGHTIDVQLKATTTWSERGDQIVYDVEAKTYNDLMERVNTPHATQLILVVLCLPENQEDWLAVSHEQLILKRCCYWCCLSGTPTDNKQTKRIEIPKANLLDCAAINRLLQKVVDGEALS